MATNEILRFAETDTGTNLLTQAEYSADSQRPIGNQPGVARSKLVNKAMRQSTLVSAGVAQYIANKQASNVVDTLTTAQLATLMENAVASQITAATGSLAPLASPALAGVPTAPTAAAGTNTTQIATTAFVQLQSLPAGSLIYYAGNAVPPGYLEANGAWLSRTTYAALFAAVGIIYNQGDGSTTFGIPDLRGEFIRCWDNGRGLDAGRWVGSFQGDLMRKHDHCIPTPDGESGSRASLGDDNGMETQSNDFVRSGPYYTYNYDTAGLLGHETRPRNVAVLICIKY